LAEGQRFELWELLHSTVFKTVALNHSAILPMGADISDTVMKCLSFSCKKMAQPVQLPKLQALNA
jgi:hypothetical protein